LRRVRLLRRRADRCRQVDRLRWRKVASWSTVVFLVIVDGGILLILLLIMVRLRRLVAILLRRLGWFLVWNRWEFGLGLGLLVDVFLAGLVRLHVRLRHWLRRRGRSSRRRLAVKE
jgi:hypothetical protein